MIIKCKMCGGDLEITEGLSVAECEYCGTKQTVPNVNSEKKMTLFGRANRLRLACEFDKAAGVYENLVAEFPEEAEAYWGLVLCRYGIEYVDDPITGKKVPTCHRSSFDSVLEDGDFEQACENADMVARKLYREEAKTIEDIRRGILEVSDKEQPYDIFICYKETDANGQRTIDSVLAQDVYDTLTDKGYRVFFSRITLEDKLGTEYEPHIFAALHSAKIMLVFGTDYEYFNAVWVKNEWSRFLKLMGKDKQKHLIPCYKNVDIYDMPKEFQKLQAQDFGKVGAIQDLVRGIGKLLSCNISGQKANENIVIPGPDNTVYEPLLRRGQLFLEECDWSNAAKCFDKVLDISPECAEAYLGKLCAEKRCKCESELENLDESFSKSYSYQKAIQFGNVKQREILERANQLAENAFAEQTRKIERIRNDNSKVNRCICTGIFETAGVKSDGTVTAVGISGCKCSIGDWKDIISICWGQDHLVGLKLDGTVVATGFSIFEQYIGNWKDIVAISCGDHHTVALKLDGTVIATGSNMYGQCNVENWKDIVTITCGADCTVGLKSDGTVRATGPTTYGQCNVGKWKDIVSIVCGKNHTIGIKADATVLATGYNLHGECNVEDWKNIVSVSCGEFHTVGLRSNGTVIATGINRNSQCNVEDWRDIVAVSCGEDRTIGLRTDGTVIATGDNTLGQCDVGGWKNIVAISCGGYHTVGLKSDGTVVATGENNYRQCDVGTWRLFKSIDSIEQERNEAEKIWREIVQRCRELELEQSQLQVEFKTLKGLFSIGKRRQIESRLSEIEMELRALHR